MKEITQTLHTNLEVTRDGYLDQSYYIAEARRQRLQQLKGQGMVIVLNLAKSARYIGAMTVKEIRRIFFLIHLDMYDAANGTNLHHEYHEQRRKREIAELRSQFS